MHVLGGFFMMLDDYIDEQKIAYTIFKNAIKKNKCSHAYLIESNGYSKTMDFVLSVAKALLCPKNLTSNILCTIVINVSLYQIIIF